MFFLGRETALSVCDLEPLEGSPGRIYLLFKLCLLHVCNELDEAVFASGQRAPGQATRKPMSTKCFAGQKQVAGLGDQAFAVLVVGIGLTGFRPNPTRSSTVVTADPASDSRERGATTSPRCCGARGMKCPAGLLGQRHLEIRDGMVLASRSAIPGGWTSCGSVVGHRSKPLGQGTEMAQALLHVAGAGESIRFPALQGSGSCAGLIVRLYRWFDRLDGRCQLAI